MGATRAATQMEVTVGHGSVTHHVARANGVRFTSWTARKGAPSTVNPTGISRLRFTTEVPRDAPMGCALQSPSCGADVAQDVSPPVWWPTRWGGPQDVVPVGGRRATEPYLVEPFLGSGHLRVDEQDGRDLERPVRHLLGGEHVPKKAVILVTHGQKEGSGLCTTHRFRFLVTKMCQVLQVSRIGYYA